MPRNPYRWCAVLISLGLLVSACGGNDDGVEEESEPAPGRTTLEVRHFIEPPTLAPYDMHGGKAIVFDAMLPKVIRLDDEGELQSDVLESWELSDDARTLTFTLRSDIEWNDGTPITSADVVMSLTQYLDRSISGQATVIGGVAGEAAFNDGQAETISGLSAPDEQTVIVEFQEPNPAWLSRFATAINLVILPEHIVGDVPHDELAEHNYFTDFPVTAGPYKFVEWASGQYIELQRDDNWSLGQAGFERLFYKFIEPDVATAQLETGEVQFISGVGTSDVDRLLSQDGIDVQSKPTLSIPSWALMNHGPLQDPRVRQAMAFAIDREGICQAAFNGRCEVPLLNIPHISPEWATPTAGVTEYRYDPDRARDLLEEANWDPNTELTFLNQFEGNREINTAFTIAQDNLADVGINWTIENVELSALLERSENAPESFHGFSSWGLDMTADPAFLGAILPCDAQYPAGGNHGRYCNEELDELFDSGRTEADPERRAEIYQEAFRILNQEVRDIYFPVPDFTIAHDSRLKGVTSRSASHDQFWNVGEWHWEENS